MIWQLVGTENQNRIISDALARSDFPFDKLLPGLRKATGRDYIPVEWADLSRYAQTLEENKSAGGHNHLHDEEWGTGHPIEYRSRVLGLAWYSGKVTLEQDLESDPELAGEIFFAEGAHMIDFFYMTDEHRAGVWNAFHESHEDIATDTSIEDGVAIGHNHGWFDVGGYYSWVGEAFMGGFIRAYTNYPVNIQFDHPATDVVGKEIRSVLTPELVTPDVPVVESPEAPVVNNDVPPPFFVGKNRKVYHDSHKGIVPVEYFTAPPEGARACKVCRPDKNLVI